MQSTTSTGPTSGLLLQEHLDGHHFVARSGGQAIESRQIHELKPLTLVLHAAGLLFDRYARVIADVLVDPHQGAEKRRLARIRIADQRDGDCCVFGRSFYGFRKYGRHSFAPGVAAKKSARPRRLSGRPAAKADLIARHADDATVIAAAEHLGWQSRRTCDPNSSSFR